MDGTPKLRKGDTREDGMMVWAIKKGKPYWVTPERYAYNVKYHKAYKIKHNQRRREEKMAAYKAHPRVYNRGDLREDGMVFVQYHIECADFEYWTSKEQFEARLGSVASFYNKKRDAFENHPRGLISGDTREHDDMVFWAYNIGSKGFEDWITPELFAIRRGKCLTPERRRKEARLLKYRRDNDPIYKLKLSIRGLISRKFRYKKYTKKSKTYKILGCSYKDFAAHIYSQFEDGMSMDNYGKGGWELDHILPVAAATTEDEVIALNHYTNFQPMWSRENTSKGDTYCPKELKVYIESRLAQVT